MAFNALSSIAGVVSSGLTGLINYENQKNFNRQARSDWNKQQNTLYSLSQQSARETPVNTKIGLLNAGISPAIMSGGMFSPAAVGSASMSHSSAPQVDSSKDVQAALATSAIGAQMENLQAQTEQARAQTAKIEAETRDVNINVQRKEDADDATLAVLRAKASETLQALDNGADWRVLDMSRSTAESILAGDLDEYTGTSAISSLRSIQDILENDWKTRSNVERYRLDANVSREQFENEEIRKAIVSLPMAEYDNLLQKTADLVQTIQLKIAETGLTNEQMKNEKLRSFILRNEPKLQALEMEYKRVLRENVRHSDRLQQSVGEYLRKLLMDRIDDASKMPFEMGSSAAKGFGQGLGKAL